MSGERAKTLLDVSLESDPELANMRIPFVDPTGKSYIDCQLAFMVDLDGMSYAIGVPFDYSAAITVEKRDGSVIYISPDDDENEELMQMMADQLQKEIGEDVSLKRTPRVLTISGDLNKYTKDWQSKMFDAVDTETLMDDSDEDIDSFLDFMKKELGEEEVEKALKADPTDIDEETMKLFSIPGFGTDEEDIEGIEKMLEDMFEDPSKSFDAIDKDLTNEKVGLKLVGFNFRDGNVYSLVQMMQPFTMVAKQISGENDDIRFELLTPEEGKIVFPRLNEVCESELQKAGLTL